MDENFQSYFLPSSLALLVIDLQAILDVLSPSFPCNGKTFRKSLIVLVKNIIFAFKLHLDD